MGELVNLKEYRAWKAQAEEEKELAEMDETINELEALKRVLEGILKDLPEPKTSIMYVPIEPKLDVFATKENKTLDGYLDMLGLTINNMDTEDDENDDS